MKHIYPLSHLAERYKTDQCSENTRKNTKENAEIVLNEMRKIIDSAANRFR